LSGPVSFEV